MYLIDGYNLLYQTTLETREELVEKINEYCRHNNKVAKIVFDGYAPEDLSSQVVEITFVGDADAEIKSIIEQNENPNQLILVSSDKDLQFTARKHKVSVMNSEHFSYIMPVEEIGGDEDQKPRPPMTDNDVAAQLEEFKNFKKSE